MIGTFLYVRLGVVMVLKERSLEIGEVLWGGGRRWWRQEAGLHIFWKKVRESLSRLSDNECRDRLTWQLSAMCEPERHLAAWPRGQRECYGDGWWTGDCWLQGLYLWLHVIHTENMESIVQLLQSHYQIVYHQAASATVQWVNLPCNRQHKWRIWLTLVIIFFNTQSTW